MTQNDFYKSQVEALRLIIEDQKMKISEQQATILVLNNRFFEKEGEWKEEFTRLEDKLKTVEHRVMYELFIDCMNHVITEEYRLKFQAIFDEIHK